MPTSLRQVTGCSAPADRVVRRRSRLTMLYQVYLCRDHRWMASRWTGAAQPLTDQDLAARCGYMIDHRDADKVFQSHSDQWLRSMTSHGPQDHGGDWAATLRAARDFLERGGHPAQAGVRLTLDYAASLAEGMGADPGGEAVRERILAALAVAETIHAQSRSW